ncbi:hypothetical protein U9M48_015499 [Paspalum notatum var. saurae]|uniref:BHLH domain-containing protein n=1 Tax=Paspalum notatum var. saurae TaxID=547442 RepID=A0AAQ3WLX8_PASNO
MASSEGTTWVFDCPLMDDLAVAADFGAASAGEFFWTPAPPSVQAPAQAVSAASAPNPRYFSPCHVCFVLLIMDFWYIIWICGILSVGLILAVWKSVALWTVIREKNSQQINGFPRPESTVQPTTKACREKIRRDKLNERFLELGAILEPGKTPKMDKSAILSDAIRVVGELRSEAKKLKDSNESLQEKIKELKAEKNELRDEKQRLKAEKESLEQQIKFLNARPSLVPHPPLIPASAFAAAQGAAAAGHKLMMPMIGYPGFPMWQFMPPSDVDTSDDPKACPPVA